MSSCLIETESTKYRPRHRTCFFLLLLLGSHLLTPFRVMIPKIQFLQNDGTPFSTTILGDSSKIVHDPLFVCLYELYDVSNLDTLNVLYIELCLYYVSCHGLFCLKFLLKDFLLCFL